MRFEKKMMMNLPQSSQREKSQRTQGLNQKPLGDLCEKISVAAVAKFLNSKLKTKTEAPPCDLTSVS